MANEKLLIDANDVYKLFDKNGFARIHVADIDLIPRVDAVEVCRCKDCKHSEPCGESRQCLHPFGLNACDGNDFCSYGERRNEDVDLR